jgi:hypothetical protein
MSYPKITLRHGDVRVWIYADGTEIGSLKLDAAGKVFDHFPGTDDLVRLVRDIYEAVR